MYRFFAFTIITSLIFSCTSNTSTKKFVLLESGKTGIDFRNRINDDPELNIFNYLYYYNGGGVASGDLNNDSLPDLYFTSNRESNKLYLNQGDFKFTDITQIANVAGNGKWTTGVTFADVNEDGLLDIYVSQVGDFLSLKGKNELFINKGNNKDGVPIFEEEAAAYGLDLVGFSNQAAFFDYDLDGDLDMYMLNHSVHDNGTFGRSEIREKTHPLAGDKLLENVDGKYVDVTSESGIFSSAIGYGLGITISDVNLDGYPDIYVGNDFHENDYLYINNKNGTFSDVLEEKIPHTSRYSMGNDIGDINNDGYPEIITLDMLPRDPKILKSSAGEEPYPVYDFKLGFGYHYQFSRNALQLNNGNGYFSDIGMFSGVGATDWSWSALFFDADLDGFKDLFISNGIYRRSNDLDYIKFISNDAIQARLDKTITEQELGLIDNMPQHKLTNFLFKNDDGLIFKDVSDDWGFDLPSYSNGSTLSDLDNDGDLDIIVNNINQEAFLYKNRTIEKGRISDKQPHYLKIKLLGSSKNKFGIGSKVISYVDETIQINEMIPTRGYLSSIDYSLVIGLDSLKKLDSLTVVWPDMKFETLYNVLSNQTLLLNYTNATGEYDHDRISNKVSTDSSTIFSQASSAELGIDFKHDENKFIEFNREPLLPHMNSTEGPCLSVADVNNDGNEDVFIGGAKWQTASLYIQNDDGKFSISNRDIFRADSLSEDVDSKLFDCDNDGDIDLLVLSGGNEFDLSSEPNKPRLYLNDGTGFFHKSEKNLPDIYLTGSSISISDFDRDGFNDIFLGASAIPWNYGKIPQSYLLKNQGDGSFRIDNNAHDDQLSYVGLVKDARWEDLNGDNYEELIVASQWAPLKIFHNEQGTLKLLDLNLAGLAESFGWWNTIETGDFDNDGDIDLVAGNLGLNSKLKTSKDQPVRMYVSDFDKNDRIDQIITYYVDNQEILYAEKDDLTKAMESFNKEYLKYSDFANASLNEIVDRTSLKESEAFYVNDFQSYYIENKGDFSFELKSLPTEVQWSPIMAFKKCDINNDGNLDLIVGGNFFNVNLQRGRYDASYGNLLIGDGKGNFKNIHPKKTGLLLKGQVRGIEEIRINGESHYMVVRNDDTPIILSM
ncbi:MAG: VCBS repeat-containing protein [Bacteroidota bacterium]